MTPTLLDRRLLDGLSGEAAGSPRLRKNLNLHPTDDYPAHRLFNAVEPGTYVRPHRHLASEKDETMVVVRGAMAMIFFDDAGNVTGTAVLSAAGEVFGVDIPHGVYHTLISLAPGTVFFEAKGGPYASLSENEKSPWAPGEGTPEAAEYLRKLAARVS